MIKSPDIHNHHPARGFTVAEILIAAGVLSLFMAGLFSLYSGGTRMSNQTMWTQNIINQLKLASRQINTSIKKSTYPSSLTFPGNIQENESTHFGLHYFNGTLHATESAEIDSTAFGGTKFIALTESSPAKTGYETSDNTDAEILYHIFALSKQGHLCYSRFRETVAGDLIPTLARPTLPGGATGVYRTTLTRDVESIHCEPVSADALSPLSVRINCRIPRGSTLRSETAIGTPNVALVPHNSVGGW